MRCTVLDATIIQFQFLNIRIIQFPADNILPDEENDLGLKEVEREIHEQCKEDGIYIDDTFVEKRSAYKSAKELFGDGNRDVVKLRKMLDDEKDKRKNLLKFTNLCVHVIKSKKKCKFCAKF